MEENIEVKDVQKTEYLDKNGLDILWAKVKENTHNQVEAERDRAVAKENSIADTKADKSALDNYVLSTTLAALEQKVTDNTTAISTKQDAGNYIPYENYENGKYTYKLTKPRKIQFGKMYLGDYYLNTVGGDGILFEKYGYGDKDNEETVKYSFDGITSNKYNDCLATSDSSFKPISDFVLKTELPTVPTAVSQLTNDSNFITAADIDFTPYATIEALTAETTARTEALTALEQKVTANTTAIEGKQNAGNYIPYKTFDNRNNSYQMQDDAAIVINGDLFGKNTQTLINGYSFQTFCSEVGRGASVEYNSIEIGDDNGPRVKLSDVGGGQILVNQQNDGTSLTISKDGIKLLNGDDNHVLTSNASTIDITQYALKTELPTVPTKTSQLTNDSKFIAANSIDDKGYYLHDALNIGLENNGVLTIEPVGIKSDAGDGFNLDGNGITFYARYSNEIPTADGSFIDIDDYALKSQVTALEQTVTDNTTALEGKQDKGNYIPYTANGGMYEITSPISVAIKNKESITITNNRISISGSDDPESIDIDRNKLMFSSGSLGWTKYDINGITSIVYSDCLATSDGTFKPISDFVLSSAYNEKIAALEARIAALEAKHP